MKHILIVTLCLAANAVSAQELYVATEPASNMAAHSIGVRLNNTVMHNSKLGTMYRLNTEVMWGVNKKLMLHVNGYFSNIHQHHFNGEGVSTYAKYRFLSIDNNHSHFRMALYGKAALINNKLQYHEINLSGDNSGVGAGLVATQLLHKLAVSFTGGYAKALNNSHDKLLIGAPTYGLNYSLSFGYLLLPIKYKTFNDPNFNVYVEFMGKSNPQEKSSFVDVFPAVQVIMNSRFRIDLGYRKQLVGNMLRVNNQELLVRLEYSFFNAY